MAFKIYTKTGDKGKTALIGGTKVPKSDLRIDAYGTIDELNSYIGLVSDYLTAHPDTVTLLREIQDRLFTIGSSLACDPDKDTKMRIPDLHAADITLLEEQMDKMNEILPEMKSFIIPGGHVAVSTCHIARCVCRRAERLCVGLQEQQQFIEPLVLQYVNRLSDYLFVLARWIGHTFQVAEIPWKARI
ncbi:cob(I)yrinic acid a,c-diamide adenosyltransferase [Chitinophaga rhizophila]|uniref:Corrinoid adenosyltransferase n=1 Tax=Chitinophaga rhizophila TaxID=2866212 RepID=A0ABS7GCI7_9BACT|nr:cob(I)yrinic acid a,c-diamide adenosyltransferase [Chitinophaga rhizophila]MBW8685391.1 cob(I)yrinic acid a,c-diamide adenosyltransferase [Chitinophaga rhizophila]